jgi:16S rRNA (adenine1518-N6/adenine1519-N6)-dimethyltransferase
MLGKIKEDLRALGIEPRKSLGQNFLINKGIYNKIVEALELVPGDTVIEIGPGLGTLTEFLCAPGVKVISIEKDRNLISFLKNKFQGNNNIEIIESDILETDLPELKEGRYKIVGNIPYYITSHLFRIIFERWKRPALMVFMVQKEVAQRVAAKPPDMSLLGVSVQYYSEPKIVSYVSKGSFYPAPKVDSGIIKLKPITRSAGINEKEFFTVAKAGFAGKRKQLANNLSSNLKIPKHEIEEKLNSAGIDPRRRAETLTVDEWQNISKILFLRD